MALYCPQCGRKLPDHSQFCDGCGTKIPDRAGFTGSPGVSQEEKKASKGSGGLLVRIAIGVILAAVAIGAGVWLRNALNTENTTSYAQRTDAPDGVDPAAKEVEDFLKGKETGSTASEKTDPAAQETVNPAGISISERTEKEETDPSEDTGLGGDVPQGILHPNGDPDFSEFLFYEEDVLLNGVPEDALMESAGQMSGDWKYCMIFNLHPEEGERFDEIGLADVIFGENSAEILLHPQKDRYEDEVSPVREEEIGYEPFTGTWDNELISVQGNQSTITIWPFYEYEGKQIMLGAIVNRQGNLGHLIFLRP